jgi:hypothetical protein
MSLTSRLVAMVNERGCATADDLLPECKGYTRAQVLKALQNAKTTGQIDSDGHVPIRGESGRRGSVCTTYRPVTGEIERAARRLSGAARFASVFHYAQGIEATTEAR